LGALVISPTRELAYQTFEVLKKIGSFHDFSAGLVIGGKVIFGPGYLVFFNIFGGCKWE
jgi:superfamily II DNA/RNA helicase